MEATSYSNPKVVPQFADASELLKDLVRAARCFLQGHLRKSEGSAKGPPDLDAGYGVNEISLLVSATESHTQKNLKRSRAEQWANIEEMVQHRGRALPPGRHGFGRVRLPFRGKGGSGKRR